ncbi:hypothetical protein F2P79_023709 [Pimephales promelas]|nr:hypothetical protein F2P79_023709 [Pimephales promelas]
MKTPTRLNECLKATFIPSGDDLSSCCLPGGDSLSRLIPFLSHLSLILSCWVNNAPPAFHYCRMAVKQISCQETGITGYPHTDPSKCRICTLCPDMKETASCLWHLTMRRAFSVSRVSKVGIIETLDEVGGQIPPGRLTQSCTTVKGDL